MEIKESEVFTKDIYTGKYPKSEEAGYVKK